jgi:hypothetical protein
MSGVLPLIACVMVRWPFENIDPGQTAMLSSSHSTASTPRRMECPQRSLVSVSVPGVAGCRLSGRSGCGTGRVGYHLLHRAACQPA